MRHQLPGGPGGGRGGRGGRGLARYQDPYERLFPSGQVPVLKKANSEAA